MVIPVKTGIYFS